jgi:hypothetical protein
MRNQKLVAAKITLMISNFAIQPVRKKNKK